MGAERALVQQFQATEGHRPLILALRLEIMMRLGFIPSLRRLFLLKDLAFGIYPQ